MENLDVLNISELEEKVYRVLLVSGQLSLGEINFATNLTPGEIRQALKSLEEKNLIRKIPGIEGRYASLVPAGSVRDELLESVEKINVLSQDLQQKSSQVTSNLKDDLHKTSLEIINQVNSQKQEVSSSLTSISDEFAMTKTNAFNEINNKLDELSAKNQEVLLQLENQSMNEISTQIEATKQSIHSRVQSIEQKTQEVIEQESEIKSSAAQNLPDTDLSSIENIQTEITGKLTAAKNSYSEQITNLNNSFNQKVSILKTNFQETKSSLDTLKNQIEQEYSGLTTTLKENLDSIISTTKQSLTEDKDPVTEINQNLHLKLEDMKTKSEQIKTDFEKVSNQFLTRYRQETDNFESEIQNSLNSVDSQISDKLTETKSSLEVSVQSKTDDLEKLLHEMTSEFLEKTKQQLSNFNQQFNQSIESTMTGLQNNLKKTKQNLIMDYSDKSKQMKQSVENQQSLANNKLSSVLTEFVSTEIESNENSSSYVNNVLNQLTSLVNTIQGLTSKFEEEIERFSNTSSGIISTNSQSHQELINYKFGETLNQIQSTLDEQLATLVNELQTSEQQLNLNFDNTHDEIHHTLSENVLNLKNGMDQLRQLALNRLDNALNEMHSSYLSYVEQTKISSIGSVNQLERDAEKLEEAIAEIYSNAKSQLNDQFDSFSKTLQTNSEQLFSSISGKLDQIISKVTSETIASYDNVASLSGDNIEKQVSKVSDTLNEYNQYYNSNTGDIVTKSTALANLLEKIFKMQETTDTPSIKTTHIVGQGAILDRIKDIISRVKSKATILIPEISMIDENSILNLPRTAQITIISYIDESNDQGWIEKLHNATANVTLRSITVSDLGGTLPDFIGIEREGEEILLAAKDEGTNDYVGITSLSEDFVQILGNIVIADYARGKSRQIAK